MKSSTISIWFPNQGINLGLLSKSIRSAISSIAEGIEIEIGETYFDDKETFIINCEYTSDENLSYLTNMLYRTYGKPRVTSDVYEGDILLEDKFEGAEIDQTDFFRLYRKYRREWYIQKTESKKLTGENNDYIKKAQRPITN